MLTARLHELDYPGISQSIAGLVTISTPHRGSGLQPIGSLIANIASAVGCAEKQNLIKYTEKDSEVVADLVQDFSRVAIANSIPIFCFFELRKSDVGRLARPRRLGWPTVKVCYSVEKAQHLLLPVAKRLLGLCRERGI